MKTKMFNLILLFAIVGNIVNAQNKGVIDYLYQLPNDLSLDKSVIQTFRLTTDYYDYDLKANFIRKTRVVGDFTSGLTGDSVKWNNVYISQVNDLETSFPQGQKQTYIENFKYVQSEKVLGENFFSNMAQLDFRIKNMVWDMLGFEVFAYTHWDSLELNTEYHAKELNGEVKMAADGTFENKDIRLTWLGITNINNEICAIIKYSQMNGPLELDMENIKMSGRSHYWGEVYVSLADKQIEYATLLEDVLTDVLIKGQSKNMLGYTVRKITLSKIK